MSKAFLPILIHLALIAATTVASLRSSAGVAPLAQVGTSTEHIGLTGWQLLSSDGAPKASDPQALTSMEGPVEIIVGGFTIAFLGVEYNADGTSTWTYSITSDSATGPDSRALSHWVLEICEPAIGGVTPADTYTTIGTFDGVLGREEITYDVVIGLDAGGTDITGIKFEDGEPNLGEEGKEETDIFQFTLDDHYVVTPVQVGTKAGKKTDTDYISGPACSLTAIELISFTAEPLPRGRVLLAWETGTEVDTAGFNLYRAIEEEGPYTKIAGLIPAKGSPVAGASYWFLDKPGFGRFFYQLEDVDIYGGSTMHGPAKTVVLPRPR